MKDFILLMHSDSCEPVSAALWPAYFAVLRESNAFQGGSAIGLGETVRKSGPPANLSSHLTGYIRVQAESLAAAKALVDGNPVFEAGGTVEVRALPSD